MSTTKSTKATPKRQRNNGHPGRKDSHHPSACQQPESPLFRRDDWTLFRNVATLGQRAGVAPDAIPKLVVKELADNALDAADSCGFNRRGRWLIVHDDGPGLPGTDADIADLFSVVRPLSSSKLLRLPTRGALGNGLRVVAGAVLASGGELIVKTGGRALRLRPRDSDGGTDVERIGPWSGCGTRVEVLLGESLPIDEDTFNLMDFALEIFLGESVPVAEDTFIWARRATALANVASANNYSGKTSAWWYDSDSFFELLQAAGARTVRDLVGDFAGCSRRKAAIDDFGKDCAANSLSRDDSDLLLQQLREAAKPVTPKRLGHVGREFRPDGDYAAVFGTFEVAPARGSLSADVPFVIEAWAEPVDSPSIEVNVNRTPITAEVTMTRGMADKTLYALFGCGLSSQHENTATGIKAGRGREYCVVVNITTPYMPITSDGKAPDLSKISWALKDGIEKAIRAAKRKLPKNKSQNNALPRRKRGRQTPEAEVEYQAHIEEFAQRIRQIKSRLDFRPSSRGYCYILENEGVITKGDFDACQKLMTDCRKAGILPLDICCDDSKRQFFCLEDVHQEAADTFAQRHVDQLLAEVPDAYLPVSFWEDQEYYVQMFVEKIDLQQLFLPVCQRFHVPVGNAGGWSDLNSRADMMRRFAQWKAEGKQCVLLYAGDFDPGGVRMSDTLMSNLTELSGAVGWDPSNLIIDRFCLNQDFIEEHKLSWIDGLVTSSGKDLADPRHRDHKKPYVQDWLRDIGPRKVEANALVTAPEAGRALCLQAIKKYVSADAPAQFKSRLDLEQGKVLAALERLVG